jgi:hypothetical protein
MVDVKRVRSAEQTVRRLREEATSSLTSRLETSVKMWVARKDGVREKTARVSCYRVPLEAVAAGRQGPIRSRRADAQSA